MARVKQIGSPARAEVAMVEAEVVRQIRLLASYGWGKRRIAEELGVGINTVRRYLRGALARQQVRPRARRLDAAGRARVLALYEGPAAGNAVVARELLAGEGWRASLRTIQRLVAPGRRAKRLAQLATVRFETGPGQQMQVDFGQKRVLIDGVWVPVHVLVAVLGYSRRLFVKAFLSERQDDWREGIAAAFQHFGGVPQVVLGDNAKALVLSRDLATGVVVFHPAYLQFCRDWDVEPRACRPYRARTKGKTESGVKYVKRNALAGREFPSFAVLEAHLSCWMHEADRRVHGTTGEVPIVRFERAERQALRPLPLRVLPAREHRLRRRVSLDAMVDVHTVRYSVPHALLRDFVDVQVGESEVRIYHGERLCAVHRRGHEPHSRIIDPQHFAGLWRPADVVEEPPPSRLQALGRSLSDYAAIVAGGEP